MCLACMFCLPAPFGICPVYPESKVFLDGKTFFFFRAVKVYLDIVLKISSLFCSDYSEIYGTVHWQRIQVLVSVFVFPYSERSFEVFYILMVP